VAGTEDHRRSSFAGRARSAVSHSGQDDHVKQTAAVAKTVAGRAGDVPKAVSRKVAREDAWEEPRGDAELLTEIARPSRADHRPDRPCRGTGGASREIAMTAEDRLDPGFRGRAASSSPPRGPGRRMVERLDERECMELIGAGRIGRLGYTGRFGPTVLPIRYKLYEGSIVFHALEDTFTEEDLRTGIAHAEYQVAFEVDQYYLEGRLGWVVEVVGSAHQVDTEAERASIINAGADPWPEAEWEHLVRVKPVRIGGLRIQRA
jgi:pyridoxamine 5'-phosphate oxidase-like protein